MASVGVLEPVERWLERLLLSMSSRGAAIGGSIFQLPVTSFQLPVLVLETCNRRLLATGNWQLGTFPC
jgi:hypothetical protein